jgi:DNA (cytosine-5)-methyltransferase 1
LCVPSETPKWKADYLRKNAEFYTANKAAIDAWAQRWGVFTDAFPASRRKLEWQAQDTARLWDTVMHLRPSGIRAKAPTYVPALVAITQTSVVGPRERRLSPREAARRRPLRHISNLATVCRSGPCGTFFALTRLGTRTR